MKTHSPTYIHKTVSDTYSSKQEIMLCVANNIADD